MSQFPSNEQNGDGWSDCQSGEVQQVVDHLQARRQRHNLAKATRVGAAATVLLAAGIWLTQWSASDPGKLIAGLTCSEVIDYAEDYVAGRLKAALQGQVDEHLAKCVACRSHIEQIKQNRDFQESPPPTPSEVHRHPSRQAIHASIAFVEVAGVDCRIDL